MNPDSGNLHHRQREQAEARQQSEQRHEPLEFQHAEDALRHDAAHTTVPETLEQRLIQSIANEPKPGSWWQRLFGS